MASNPNGIHWCKFYGIVHNLKRESFLYCIDSIMIIDIKLQSSDGQIFEVTRDMIECSETIKTLADNRPEIDKIMEKPIVLSKVNSATLYKVVEWTAYHKDDLPVSKYEYKNKTKRTDNISCWDAAFLNMSQGDLFQLILAANYLQIKGLFDVACKVIANMIKGKSPEQLREIFNIQNDFSEVEEAILLKENGWCEEN